MSKLSVIKWKYQIAVVIVFLILLVVMATIWGTVKEPFSISMGTLTTNENKQTVIPLTIKGKDGAIELSLTKANTDHPGTVALRNSQNKTFTGAFDMSNNSVTIDDVVLGKLLSDPVLTSLPAPVAGEAPPLF